MDRKPLNLWWAYPDDLLRDGVAEACTGLLGEDERARVARFKFEKNRRESITTRALARMALSSCRMVAPEAWRYAVNEHGKPSVEPGCGLEFNLSNSLGLVVCLIAEGAEVGVDVEPMQRATEILKLAPRVFSAEEQAQLEALAEGDREERALSLWTLKEAYIKARGMGLALPLDKFSFLFGGAEGVRLEIDASLEDKADRWNFFMLDQAGHRVAGMVERSAGRELDVWEARPANAAPTRVNAAEVRWYPLDDR